MRTTIKALVAAVVLGIPALASAAPCSAPPGTTVTVTQPVVVNEPVITHPIVIAHRGWVDLSGPMQLHGADVVAVGRDKGTFDKLELVRTAGYGEEAVKTVQITFGDGQVQTVRLDQPLSYRDQKIQIDLAGKARHIQSVAITGHSRGNAGVELRAV
jgi:hypothetical protein